MSNIYKIGTRGLTPYDNNYLVWDADVRKLYIDKDTPVDIVSITDTLLKKCNGTTPQSFTVSVAYGAENTVLLYSGEGTNAVYYDKLYATGSSSSSDIKITNLVYDADTNTIISFTMRESDLYGYTVDFQKVDDGEYTGIDENGFTRTVHISNVNADVYEIEYSTDRVPSLACLSGQFSETTTSAGTTGTGVYDTVVKYWKSVDGTMWYRLWASGWVEQGGVLSYDANTTVTLSLPMEFSDTKYNVAVMQGSSGSASIQIQHISVWDATTTSFVLRALKVTSDSDYCRWYTCGWSA